jgi:hypothetical protein
MKYLFSTIVILSFVNTINAQSFFHGGGLGYQVMLITDSTGTLSDYEGGISYGIAYEARLNVKDISDNFSVSVSTMPMMMFNFSGNSRTGSELSFALDIPVMVGINLGALATKESDSTFGLTLSGGYGFTTGLTSSYVTGPVANLGLRVSKNKDLGFNLTYMSVSNSEISGHSIRGTVLYYF